MPDTFMFNEFKENPLKTDATPNETTVKTTTKTTKKTTKKHMLQNIINLYTQKLLLFLFLSLSLTFYHFSHL